MTVYSNFQLLNNQSSADPIKNDQTKCAEEAYIKLKSTHQSIKYLRRRQWHPAPVLLPGKSHGRRSLEGCNPWGRWGSDTTEWLHFHFSLSCIGEGNGNPLQCSCLENPRNKGAWWAAVYGVTQSQTRLKQLSSSSIEQSVIPFKLKTCVKLVYT